jgi:small-conductance mechanosensitive channel
MTEPHASILQRGQALLDRQPDELAALLVFVVFVACAWVAERLGERALRRWLASGPSTLTSAVVDGLARPALALIVIMGVHIAARQLEGLPEAVLDTLTAALRTLAVLVTARSMTQAARDLIEHQASSDDGWVRPHAAPLAEIAAQLLIGSLALYLAFLAWSVDLTSWLASAGILGVAIGFAAQETVSNLFAGLFILADSPYRVDDFVVLEDGTRGRVTDIGLRSTRLVTPDASEVIVPNSKMASSKILNLSAGPLPLERCAVTVQVPYDVDLDLLRHVLDRAMLTLPGADHPREEARPGWRLLAFEASGIAVRVFAFGPPDRRDLVQDALVRGVLGALRGAGVAIPFPHLDVRMREPAPTALPAPPGPP